MDYSEIYRSKLMTADQAAAQVDSGWVLGMDAAPTQADGIIAAVTEHVKNSSVHDVKVHMMLDGYPYEFFTSDALNGKINGVSWFSSGGARKAVNGGYADLIPGYYRDMPQASAQITSTTHSAYPCRPWTATVISAWPPPRRIPRP